jgi:twinkle protein
LFLDHVTLAVHEFGDGIMGNPAQDQMMNEFLELCENTGVHLFLLSHLRKAPGGGKSFEEGAVPSLDDLKGSGSLKQVSMNIIGVSRNLQHEDNYERNVSQLHVLKCRETGKTGRCDRLYWDDESRSLVPAKEPELDDAPPVQQEGNNDF